MTATGTGACLLRPPWLRTGQRGALRWRMGMGTQLRPAPPSGLRGELRIPPLPRLSSPFPPAPRLLPSLPSPSLPFPSLLPACPPPPFPPPPVPPSFPDLPFLSLSLPFPPFLPPAVPRPPAPSASFPHRLPALPSDPCPAFPPLALGCSRRRAGTRPSSDVLMCFLC